MKICNAQVVFLGFVCYFGGAYTFYEAFSDVPMQFIFKGPDII